MKTNYQKLTTHEIGKLISQNSNHNFSSLLQVKFLAEDDYYDLLDFSNKEELLAQLRILIENQKNLLTYFSNISSTEINVNEERNHAVSDLEFEPFFIKTVKEIVEANYADENFALPELCEQLNMSRSQVFRKMKNLIGESPSSFIRSFRLQKAKVLLQCTEYNISEIAWRVGYKDLSHFSKSFQSEFGKSPSDIR